jgi:peptide-methionine (S)-S-oxide reductase
MATKERAVLADGCFWGMQDLIRMLHGVAHTRVGYGGGNVKNATYRNHAEAIEIIFDTLRSLAYRDLLEFFLQIHDPSTKNRQGNDRGASCRSAIYFTSPEQERIARDAIADVDASGLWQGPAATELAAAGDFWEAEPEHRDLLRALTVRIHVPFRGGPDGSCRDGAVNAAADYANSLVGDRCSQRDASAVASSKHVNGGENDPLRRLEKAGERCF